MVYWLELVIIGLFNILKMAFAAQLGELGKSRSYQGIFFIAHYATFVVLYGTLLRLWVAGPDTRLSGGPTVLLALLIFGVSHGISFKLNYIDRKESSRITSLLQMAEPYKRVIPVQFALVAGAFLVREASESAFSLALLALVKLAVDLATHIYLHRAPAGHPG